MAPRLRCKTPPQELMFAAKNSHLRTPCRSAVLAVVYFCQQNDIRINAKDLKETFGYAERSIKRILETNQARTFHNIVDNGPDPRGPNPVFTKAELSKCGDYLDNCSFDEATKPWRTCIVESGTNMDDKLTYHFKTKTMEKASEQCVQRALRDNENFINAIPEVERELDDDLAKRRFDFAILMLGERPEDHDWRDVVFCDEFHFGMGLEVIKRVKRRHGQRHWANKVQKKKFSKKDEKDKETRIKVVSAFVVFGYNYRKLIWYNAGNKNGKMSTECYLRDILPYLRDDLRDNGYTLFQDADGAHKSKKVLKWFQDNDIKTIINCAQSPDFSIAETEAGIVKKRFHEVKVTTKEEAEERIVKVMSEMLDQNTVCKLYDGYTERLWECKQREGQMTRF